MTAVDTNTIMNCPACGASLTEEPVTGSFRVYHCPTHRTFSISGTAIQMAHNLPAYMETLGRRIQEARDSESSFMIMADDLTRNDV
jgi:hypothetical protein